MEASEECFKKTIVPLQAKPHAGTNKVVDHNAGECTNPFHFKYLENGGHKGGKQNTKAKPDHRVESVFLKISS